MTYWNTDDVVDEMVNSWEQDMQAPAPVDPVEEFNRALFSLASVTYAVAWHNGGALLKGWMGDPAVNDLGFGLPWADSGSEMTHDQKIKFLVEKKGKDWSAHGWRVSNPNGTDPQPRADQQNCILCGSEGDFPMCADHPTRPRQEAP